MITGGMKQVGFIAFGGGLDVSRAMKEARESGYVILFTAGGAELFV